MSKPGTVRIKITADASTFERTMARAEAQRRADMGMTCYGNGPGLHPAPSGFEPRLLHVNPTTKHNLTVLGLLLLWLAAVVLFVIFSVSLL